MVYAGSSCLFFISQSRDPVKGKNLGAAPQCWRKKQLIVAGQINTDTLYINEQFHNNILFIITLFLQNSIVKLLIDAGCVILVGSEHWN